MPRFLPVGKDAEGAAKFLLAALPALGALLTALAITGDLVGRMARDHPWATFGAFGCAALAVFLGALAAFGFRAGSSEERRALYLGLGALGAGLVCTVFAGVRTWGDRPQPSVTLTPRRGSVQISVRAAGRAATACGRLGDVRASAARADPAEGAESPAASVTIDGAPGVRPRTRPA